MVLPLGGAPILLPGTRFDRQAVAPLVTDIRPGFDLAGALREALKDAGLARARLGLAGSDVMPVYYEERLRQELPGLRLEPADELIEGLRIVKSPFEIRVMEAAARVCDAGLEAAVRASRCASSPASSWRAGPSSARSSSRAAAPASSAASTPGCGAEWLATWGLTGRGHLYYCTSTAGCPRPFS